MAAMSSTEVSAENYDRNVNPFLIDFSHASFQWESMKQYLELLETTAELIISDAKPKD